MLSLLLFVLLIKCVVSTAIVPIKPSWGAATTWLLPPQNYTLQFCTSNGEILDDPDGTLFQLLSLPSSHNSSITTVTEKALGYLRAFAPRDVTRRTVTNETVVSITTSEDAPIFINQALFTMPVAGSIKNMCGSCILDVQNQGNYALFSTYELDLVSVEILVPTELTKVSMEKCISGCVSVDDDGSSMADEELDEIHENKIMEKIMLHSNKIFYSRKLPILCAILICLTSFTGYFTMNLSQVQMNKLLNFLTSFSGGCLLGVVAFYTSLDAAMYLVDVKFGIVGACVLIGLLTAIGMEYLAGMLHQNIAAQPPPPEIKAPVVHFPRTYSHYDDSGIKMLFPGDTPFLEEEQIPEHAELSDPPPQDISKSVIYITILGDFFHGFINGVVLTVTFSDCTVIVGWTLAIGLFLHEIPHRLGDYFMFLRTGVSIMRALVVNFIASLSLLVGVLSVLLYGHMGNHIAGIILSFGSGNLLYISLTQVLPAILSTPDRKQMFIHLTYFVCGCVAVGVSAVLRKTCELTTNNETHVD